VQNPFYFCIDLCHGDYREYYGKSSVLSAAAREVPDLLE
jgi:hypothetical protein